MMGGEAPPSKVILCDLLASAVHALTTGGTADDISLCFSRFYSDTEINEAREKALGIGIVLPRRSVRKETGAKLKFISELVQAVIDLDFRSSKFTFAAVDLTRLCYVPKNIDDEIQIRTELATLKVKYDDLEKMLKEVVDSFKMFSTNIQSTTMEISKSVELIKGSAKEFEHEADVSKAMTSENSVKPWCDTATTRRVLSQDQGPVISNHVDNRFKNILLSPSDPRSRNELFNCETPPGAPKISTKDGNHAKWEVVRKRKPKKNMIVGVGQSSSIKAVKPVKITSVFLTRCDPVTTTEEVNSYLKDTNGWEVNDVVQLNTKNTGYASFRVDVKLRDEDTDNSIIEGKHWPPGTYVRKFHRVSRMGSFGRPDERVKSYG